ncbi:BBL_G0028350.mRNA.1.CDS.1 [Saccharomyces cerevisiae]|nr:BBL_G0028350.mRNA.1.CDS.1 [Saccharomyces cerevisiae]CAI7170177.1 BBL_G0028350.mRNA.1.CDS.1 [Saccharomyces cerevisiae]
MCILSFSCCDFMYIYIYKFSLIIPKLELFPSTKIYPKGISDAGKLPLFIAETLRVVNLFLKKKRFIQAPSLVS